MKMILSTAIARAVDERNTTLAGWLSDWARENGLTHRELFERVSEVRPDTTSAEWDELLAGADHAPICPACQDPDCRGVGYCADQMIRAEGVRRETFRRMRRTVH